MKVSYFKFARPLVLIVLACLPTQAKSYSDEIRKADIVLSIKDANSLDVGIGCIRNGKREPLYFSQEFLRGFLRRERQKDLILVCQRKHGLLNESLKKLIRAVGFRRIVTCDLKADDVYAARRRMTKAKSENASIAKYSGLRELECVATADQLTMNIGMEIKCPNSDVRTQVVSDSMFTREELLPFLQQDVKRQSLAITLPKNFSKIEEEKIRTFVAESNFPHFEIERSRGFFKGIPIPFGP